MKQQGKYYRRLKIYAEYISKIEGSPYIITARRGLRSTKAQRHSKPMEWFAFFRRKDDRNGYARVVGRNADKDLAYKMILDFELRHSIYCKTGCWEEIEIKAVAMGICV